MSERRWTQHPPGYDYEPARGSEFDCESPRPNIIEYKRYNIFARAEWGLEILTSIASLAVLAVVGYIFWRVDNKPLSDWTWPISLNAIISVLTTVCSAAIMHGVSAFISQLKWLHFKKTPKKLEHFDKFDEASRGPWGSLKFLTGMKPNLATIGALITIFRLGLSPLAQQVVKIDERLVSTIDSAVTFGYTYAYDRGLVSELTNTGILGIPQDPNMQAAILQGLYNITTPATFSCPGACRWHGSYVSLGFSTSCQNVTEETLQSMTCSKDPKDVVEYCNMTTPGNIDLSAQHVMTDSATSYRMNVSSLMEPTQVTIPDTFPELVRFAVYRATPDHNFVPYNVNITECSLFLAAHKYTGARSNGTTFAFEDTEKIELGGKESWATEGRLFTGTIFANESRADGLPRFTLSWADFKALQNFFQSETIVTEWVDGNYQNRNLGLSAALAGDVDIEKRFEKMAVSMTDYLRSGPNREFARGEKMNNVPFVSIRWWFFLGPVAIEALALLFAVSTIFSNRKSRKVPLWKSSALAVLACEHGKNSELIRTKVKDIKQIEKAAEESFVKLE